MDRRICFWVDSIFKLGGIKRAVTNVANLLSRDREVTVITNDSFKDENRTIYGISDRVNIIFVDEGIVNNRKKRIYERSFNNNLEDGLIEIEKNYLNEEERRYYIDIITEGQYDWVIGVADLGVALAIISENIVAKTIWWQHNCLEDCLEGGKRNFYNMLLIDKYVHDFDHIVVPTEYEACKYFSLYMVLPKVIFNPIGFRSTVTAELSSKIFFASSRLTYMKGMDLLIGAYTEFCKWNDEWKLVIAGSGNERETMIKMAKENGIIDRIKFIGFTNKIKECLLNSAVLLVPSRRESWGLTILEAFEFGVPVIAWDYIPLNMFLVNKREGILVKPYDIQAFAEAMREVASNKMELLEMGKKAKIRANDFNDEIILNKWNELLDARV